MTEPQTSNGFTRVADVSEFPEGKGRSVFLDGTRVAVYKKGGRFFAFNDRCPHMGASLSEGYLSGGMVRCHWHGWRFNVQTGECEQKPWARLPTYEVLVQGSDLLLRRVAQEKDREEVQDQEEPWMTWNPDAGEPDDGNEDQ